MMAKAAFSGAAEYMSHKVNEAFKVPCKVPCKSSHDNRVGSVKLDFTAPIATF
jgi:hypothetical protein